MDSKKQYTTHAAGLLAFFSWLELQKEQGMPAKISSQTVYFHPMISKYFSIGISKNKKYKKEPFIGIQSQESAWMRLIKWDRVVIRKNDMHIYLISSFINGNKIEYPDLPPFAIALSVDHIGKTNLIIEKINTLIGREYFLDGNTIRVNYHTNIFSLPVIKLLQNEPVFDNDNAMPLTTHMDIVRKKEHLLNTQYTNSNILFQGETSQNDESSLLLKKINAEALSAKKIQKEIESSLRGKQEKNY